MYARAVMGNATDANGDSFAMKLSRRIKSEPLLPSSSTSRVEKEGADRR